MMMIKFYICGLPMLFASLFNFFGKGEEPPYRKNEALMTRIVNSSIKQLSTRYGVVAIGTGGGNVEDKSRFESVSFNLYHKLNKEEARILLVEVVELFLHNINQNKDISPYLYDNPFTYRNLEFVIFLYNENGSDLFHPELGAVSLTPRGTISFVTYESSEICKRATDIEEPYEEAYRIVTQREYPKENLPSTDTP